MSDEPSLEKKKKLLATLDKLLGKLPSITSELTPADRAKVTSEILALIGGSVFKFSVDRSPITLVEIVSAFVQYSRNNPETTLRIQRRVIEQLRVRLEADLSAATTPEQKTAVIQKHIEEASGLSGIARIVTIWVILQMAGGIVGHLTTEQFDKAREALGLPTNVLKLETPHYVVVVGDNVRLRSSPSYEQSTILRHLQQGVVLEQHDMNGDWVKVSVVLSDLGLGNLDVGWVHRRYISPVARR